MGGWTDLALAQDGVVDVELPRLVHRHDLATGEKDDLDDAPDVVPHGLHL